MWYESKRLNIGSDTDGIIMQYNYLLLNVSISPIHGVLD